MAKRGQQRRGGAIVEGEGLCPKCGGAGRYRYHVEGMPTPDARVEVEYAFECPFCGYREKARILLPLKAAYYLRYLLPPPVMVEVERAWHASRLKAALDECVGGCEE